MRVAKQLSVTLPNKPGQLASLCKKLAAAKVNIRAISVVEATEQGIVRLVADKSSVALGVIEKAGLGCVVSQVVLVEMANKPGVLAKVATKLSKAKINIQYAYGSSGPGAREAIAVLGVEDVKKARQLA